MARIIDWILDGLARWRAVDPSVAAAQYVPPPHAHLLDEHPLERVGWGGTRRCCYRIGNTGFCVKFYKPEELYDRERMKPSIRRDILRRRFSFERNSSSAEVSSYECFWMKQSEDIRSKLLPVVERVFYPKYGWGILETYYTNPDGTAIIPYEFEIARQTPENQEVIYAQAKRLLDTLVSVGAPFYEPGNFHVLVGADGALSLRIVDFEPESKMLIPLESIWPWYRRLKLARKARRYLAHIRARYGVCGKSSEWLAAERGFGVGFSDFVRLSVGKTSVNFRATTADGSRYFVKFARARALERARLVDSNVDCPLVGKMAFGGRAFPYGDCMCFAYAWIENARSIRPQDLTTRQARSLAEAYGRLSDALKDLDVGEGSERPIHGDLHYDNVFFRGDEAVAFFDFEMLRRGLPTEDLVRVFCHRLERTRFWNVSAVCRLYAAFRSVVDACSYSREDWRAAIDRAERDKRASRLRKRRGMFVVSVENVLRSWIYCGLRRFVR